jgi:hypothetical protein
VKIRKTNGAAEDEVWPGKRLLSIRKPRPASQQEKEQRSENRQRSGLRSADQMLKADDWQSHHA